MHEHIFSILEGESFRIMKRRKQQWLEIHHKMGQSNCMGCQVYGIEKKKIVEALQLMEKISIAFVLWRPKL